MDALESETLIKVEQIKAKAAIAVAVLHNATNTGGVMGLNQTSRESLIKYIREAQATIDE